MIAFLRNIRFSRLARLLGLAATPFVFSTCELVNSPGAAGGEISVTFAPGFTTMVVGRVVSPPISVTQGGTPVTDPRLAIVSSDPTVLGVEGASIRPNARGTATLHARLITSTLGQNPPGDSITVQVIAAGIRTDAAALTLRSINETATVPAHALDNAGGDIPAPISWTSSNPSVATVVDTTGLITAISNGTATLTASVDGRTATVAVTVTQQLARFEFTPNQVVFGSLNDTLTVTVTPKDAGGTTIPPAAAPPRTLTSTFPSRASVTPAGRITSLANGTAGIEARSGTVADTLGVQVTQVAERVVITGPDSVLIEAIGDTTKLIAIASDELSGSVLNATPNFRVVSADAGLVIVDPLTGVVRSLAVGGPARIIASLDNGADTVRVYVTNDPRVLEVTPANVLITAVGDATQLAGTPRNRLGAILPTIPVTWGTTDPLVATVDGVGLVTATGVGTGRIVGTALGGLLADTAVINVVNSPDSVDITSADSALTSFNDTWEPAAVIKNSRNAPLARNAVDWVSDDPGIATVSPLGLVRAISAGVVKIRATNPLNAARTDSVTVTVTNEPISISLNRSLDTLTSPTKTLTYVADSRNARGVQVDATAITWISSLPGVATVAAGLATAVAPGTTTITAQVTGGSGILSAAATLVVRNAPKTLSVSPTAAQLTFVGATQQITPTVLNDLGNAIPGSVLDWESSNPLVASVSGSGLVTALAVGTTIITVKVGNLLDTLSASTSIEVSNAPASIDITQTSVTLASINDVFATTGTYLSGQGASLPSSSATWTSDDPSVAEVTSSGVITARARGTTTVRATSPLNASITDAVAVTVTNAPVSLALNRTSDNLSSLGRTLSYSATVLNAAGAQIPNELVTWTSSAPGVASLAAGNAQDNLATALSVGSTEIIAAVGSGPGLRADTALLTVVNTAVSVAITPAPANISAVGGQLVLTATARNELGNVIPGAPAAWQSLNPSVATVTSPGATTTVTGAGVGSVTVTATVDGVTAQLTVSVANDLVVLDIVTGNTTLASVNDTLIPTVDFRNGTGTSLPADVAVWSSSDDNVATVSGNGTIVARGAGSAVIRAHSPLNEGIFDEITITVTNAPATVTLNRNDTTLTAVGRTLNIGATVFNARGGAIDDAPLTWFSRTPGVAAVDNQGLLTAVGAGTSRVGALSGLAGDSIVVTVTNNAASVSVSPGSVTISSIGATASVTPTVRNDLGNAIGGATVTWAVVPAAGVVSVPGGATNGAQNITATGGGTATVTITAASGITTSLPVTVRDDPTTVDFGTTTAVTLLNLRRTDDLFNNVQTVIRNALSVDLPASAVNWTTTNGSVVSVSADGVVTGVGAGTAKIAATSPVDPTKTDTVTYTVQAPAYSITLNQSTDSLTALTQSRIYTATVRDSLGNVLPGVGGSIAWTDASNAGPKVTFTPTTGFSTTATATTVSGATRATLTATVTPTTVLAGASLAAAVNVGVGNDPASVVVTPAAVTITSVGATASITPTVRNNLGNAIAGATVTWSVVPALGVVSVPGGTTSGAQNITATGAGTATVTITAASGITTSLPVTVRDDPTTVDFGTTTAVTLLNLGRTDDLFANAQTVIQDALNVDLPASAVNWTTTNGSVVTVSAAGLVTGVGAGTAKIAATSPVDPTRTDTVTYTVQAPAYSVTLDYATDSLTALTQSRLYTATVRDSLGNVLPGLGGSIAWTDANNTGPQVTFTPTTGYTTTATAAAVTGSIRATLTATVTPVTALAGASLAASVDIGVGNDAASVAASPSAATITSIGGTASITPTVRNNLGGVIAGAQVTWATSNAGVVTVPLVATTGAQNITGVGTGTAVVTITAASGVETTVFVTVTRVASAATSTITAFPTTIVANGVATSAITVQLKDAGGSNLTTGGDAVTLAVQAAALGTSLGTVFDNNDGTYTATLTAGTTLGQVTITGTVNTVSMTDNATVDLIAGPAAVLVITGSGSQQAGDLQTVTITAQDAQGHTAVSYTGGHSLTFSGALASLSGQDPTATNNVGGDVNFGLATLVNFAAGVASSDIKLYRVQTALIAATDGSIAAAGANRLSVDVTADDFDNFEFIVASPQTNGLAFTGTNTLTARDQWHNTVTTFDASADPVTIFVDTPLNGTVTGLGSGNDNELDQAGDFTLGVANLTGSMTYTGAADDGTFTAQTLATFKFGTSNTVTVQPGAVTHLAVGGSASQTAGLTQVITIAAQDLSGNIVPSYSGDQVLTFSGANDAATGERPTVQDKNAVEVEFGDPTTITFTGGLASRPMRLFFAEDASINVDDGTFNATGFELDVTVNAAGLDNFEFSLTTPQTVGVEFTGSNTLTARDQYNNVKKTFNAADDNVTISADAPLTNVIQNLGSVNDDVLDQAGDFVDGVADLSDAGNNGLYYAGVIGTGTFTATSTLTSKTGQSNAVTLNSGAASQFVITGSGTQSAGDQQLIQIEAIDVGGNTATTYTGDHVLTFSGAQDAFTLQSPTVEDKSDLEVAFGDPTTITFAAGIATRDMRLVRAETALISAADGPINAVDNELAVTVSAAALDNFSLVLDDQLDGIAFTGINTLTARDQFNNTVTTFEANTDVVTFTTAPAGGTVSGLSGVGALNSTNDFDQGVADLTVLGIIYTGPPTGPITFTATSASAKTGNASITITP